MLQQCTYVLHMRQNSKTTLIAATPEKETVPLEVGLRLFLIWIMRSKMLHKDTDTMFDWIHQLSTVLRCLSCSFYKTAHIFVV